jgi:hypothetical protein
MGQNARRKRERSKHPEAQAEAQAPPEAAPRARGHRLRMILLILIPVLAIGGALGSLYGLESKAGAGMILLLGCVLWITAFAVDLREEIPPRDRLRASGLGFGRKDRA